MLVGLIMVEFLCLLLLGFWLLKLIQWETHLRENREQWLHQLRESCGRLRAVRRQLADAGHGIPGLELSPANRRKWQLFRWAGQALVWAGRARS
jgi:hypothetical protein